MELNKPNTKTTMLNRVSSCRWDNTTLDKIGYWSTGGTPSRKNSNYYGGDIPWIKSGDLNDSLVNFTLETINEEGLSNSNAKILPEGTVSMALYGATLGKLGILGKPAATNQACANCIVFPEICFNKYLFYYLRSQRQNLIEAGQGGAQPNLTNKIVRNWSIPLPSLQEQQQIVAQIEKLLARVNTVKERLDRVPAIMQQFRQSVLAAACSGRLTEDCRRDIEWKTADFKSVVTGPKDGIKTGPFGSMLKKFEHQPDGIPVWGIENVKKLQFLPHNKIFITKEKADQLSNYNIVPGDILLTRSGTVGELCVVPDNINESRFSSNLMRIRLKTNILNPYFCCFLLYGSPSVLKQISDSCGGSTRIFIDGKILKNLKISFPPLTEQEKIINRVNTLFTHANRIEYQVSVTRKRIETITQSILHQAFTGKLIQSNESLMTENS